MSVTDALNTLFSERKNWWTTNWQTIWGNNWLPPQIVHCIRIYWGISNASFVFFETDKGINWKLLPITAFVLQVNCLEAVCRGLETLFVYVCERATDMVYNVCLLRKVATEGDGCVALGCWNVLFWHALSSIQKNRRKKRHCRHQKTAQLISHFCAGSVVRWCHRQWSNYYP